MAAELLRVDGLDVRLGDRDILRSVSFAIPPSSLLAILGPNGSGKSTLLRTLLGLVMPRRGTMILDGLPIGQAPAGAVGYVPQIKSLDRAFPARAIELVASAYLGRWPGVLRPPEREEAMEALARVGAAHLADRSIGVLSGGELQRIYLARSIARRPRLILLDEPETGVDAAGSADLHALLDGCRGENGSAVVLVTHDWEAAMYHATHVLLLRNSMVSFGDATHAFTEEAVRSAFGHTGHAHGRFAPHRHGHD